MEKLFFLFYLNDSLDLFNLCFFLLMQARLCVQFTADIETSAFAPKARCTLSPELPPDSTLLSRQKGCQYLDGEAQSEVRCRKKKLLKCRYFPKRRYQTWPEDA